MNSAQVVFFVITPWHLSAPHQISRRPAALLTRAAATAGTNVPDPTAHYSLLYGMDEGSEHTARQSG